MYSERLQSIFHRREHAGTLSDATHFGEGGTRGAGPYVQLWVRCEGDRIQVARFRTFGCPAAIACADTACGLSEGRTLDEARRISAADITEQVGGVPEGKEHCPELAVAALSSLVPVVHQR